jgi:hypothetical protein
MTPQSRFLCSISSFFEKDIIIQYSTKKLSIFDALLTNVQCPTKEVSSLRFSLSRTKFRVSGSKVQFYCLH